MSTSTAMSTNTTMLATHSFDFSITTAVHRFSWSNGRPNFQYQRSTTCLWLRSQLQLASRQRSLRQPKDQWTHISSDHSSICLHPKIGHWRVWSSFFARGGIDVSASQQSLASKAGPWSWAVPDPYRGGVYDGVAVTTQKQRHRPGQSLQLSGTSGCDRYWTSFGTSFGETPPNANGSLDSDTLISWWSSHPHGGQSGTPLPSTHRSKGSNQG